MSAADPTLDDRPPDAIPQWRPTSVLFLAGAALLLLAIAATGVLVARTEDANRWVGHTLEVETRLESLQSLVLRAESAERGYLLAGNGDFLASYAEAEADFRHVLDQLGHAIADNPVQVDATARLGALALQRFAILQSAIDMRRSVGEATATFALLRGNGPAVMLQLRGLIAEMAATEQGLLLQRQAQVTLLQRWLQGTVIALVILVLALAGLAVQRARRQAAALAAGNARLRRAHDRLLQEAARGQQLEEQLRQAQKMEAIGQLTGGLAHDFNNMLAVITGSVQLLRRRLAQGRTDTARLIEAALDGADRAAALTARLLAFARRQPLNPVPIDANRFVAGMSDLLHRSLGEAIRLETILAGGLWRTLADPSQLESAVLNLAVNARDAMPDGGRLTIETGNAHLDDAYAANQIDVPAGQYVLIAVSDTGTGMPPDVVARAFDPFFTTKAVGQGTGLGLSQVYGFVRQSGGHVKIYSETGPDGSGLNGIGPDGAGRGTIVKLYLPRTFSPDLPTPPVTLREAPPGTRREIILVVEDESRVRQLAVELLRELGYTVHHASSAAAGLALLDTLPIVSMLLTDVVMPDMNGRRLADAALIRRPDLKLLFMTGYTRNAIVHNDVLDPGVQLLSKPFSLEQLASKVREVLGPAEE